MAGRQFPLALQGLAPGPARPKVAGTDPNAGAGTPDGHFPIPDHTPFMTGDNGPFECANCQFFDSNTCSEPHIVDFASRGLFGLTLADPQHASVDENDCSDYFTPKSGQSNGPNS